MTPIWLQCGDSFRKAALGTARRGWQYLHLRSWHVCQLHGTTETLILLGIIVLEPDLQLYGLCEVPLLILSLLQDACISQ